MTIATTITALQTIHRGITGITSAPDGSGSYPIPDAVGNNVLPMVLLFPAAMDLAPDTQSSAQETRTYDGIVLCTPDPAGVGVNTSVTAIWPIIDAFKARYATMLANDERVASNTGFVLNYHDDGQRSITYRGVNYEGFLFRVTVWAT